jgi:DNA-binding IclR family transcriptional regulator
LAASNQVGEAPRGVLQRGLLVLRSFAETPTGLSLSEVSRRTRLDKSTTYRMLQVLVEEGLLRHDVDRQVYMPHLGLLHLGSIALRSLGYAPFATHELLVRLRDQTGESASFHIRSGAHRLCVDHVESLLPLRMTSRVGDEFPIFVGAPGRAITAFLDDAELNALIRTRESLGIWEGRVNDLRKELERTRSRGYALSQGETTQFARAISVPLRDVSGKVVGAISVSGPEARFLTNAEEIEAFAEQLRKACVEPSESSGQTASR